MYNGHRKILYYINHVRAHQTGLLYCMDVGCRAESDASMTARDGTGYEISARDERTARRERGRTREASTGAEVDTYVV